MADSNAPEHTDRGLFGMFGKKNEKPDQHSQQQSHSVDTHATHAPSYTAHRDGGNAYGGHAQPHSVEPYTTHTPLTPAKGRVEMGMVARLSLISMVKGRAEMLMVARYITLRLLRFLIRPNITAKRRADINNSKGSFTAATALPALRAMRTKTAVRRRGRKKMGMKEKPHGYDGETETQEGREKKGMMDEIKETLPGGSHG